MKYKAVTIDVAKDATFDLPEGMEPIGVVYFPDGWKIVCVEPAEKVKKGLPGEEGRPPGEEESDDKSPPGTD